MNFVRPGLLVLLIVPLLLILWTWRRQGGRVALPFDFSPQARGTGWRVAVDSALTVPSLLLAVAIAIIAGPQRLSEPKTQRVMTNIEFCVDCSGSMTSKLGEGTRYDASMQAINSFLDFRKGDAFGLTFFGNSVLHWVPLTKDISAFRCAPPFMRPEVAPPWMGGTEIGKALKACQKILVSRQEGDRMIVLISDGFSFDLGNGNDEIIAESLRADRIVVFAIHVAETSVPDQIVNVARLTGGEVFPVDDPQSMTAVFKRIDEMKETKIERIAPETTDDFFPWCIAGLTLLGTSLLSQFGLRYTPW